MKRQFATMLIATVMLVSAPAYSAPPEGEGKDPQSLASEGVQQLIRAMELMLLSIPQFEAPVINENGDIVIRRKNPKRQRHEDKPAIGKKEKAI